MHTPQKPTYSRPSRSCERGRGADVARAASESEEFQEGRLLTALVAQMKSDFFEKFTNEYSPRLIECGVENAKEQIDLLCGALQGNGESDGDSISGDDVGLTPQSQTSITVSSSKRQVDLNIEQPQTDGLLSCNNHAMHKENEIIPTKEEDAHSLTSGEDKNVIYSSSQGELFTRDSTEAIIQLVESGDVRLLDGQWVIDQWRKSSYMRQQKKEEDEIEARLGNRDTKDLDDIQGLNNLNSSLVMTLLSDDDLMNHPEHKQPVTHHHNFQLDNERQRKGESKEGHYILKCRQELPEEAFFDAKEFCQLFDKNKKELRNEDLQVVCLSYPWLDEKHPDPTGFHFTCVAPVLEMYSKLESKWRKRKIRIALFWDWASHWQPSYFPSTPLDGQGIDEISESVCCSEEQAAAYERAIHGVKHWFVHPSTLVLLQSWRLPGHAVNKSTGETLISHGRPIPRHPQGRWFERRLWCTLERSLAELISPSHMLLDLNTLFKLVKKWGLNGQPLVRFVDKYMEQADAYKNPECWAEVMRIEKWCLGSGDIAVDLIRRREDEILEPHKFDKSHSKLKLKMVSDRKVISQCYRSAFQKLFQSDDFDSLMLSDVRWAFDLGALEQSCFARVGQRLIGLNLSDNPELCGDLSLFECMVSLKSLSLRGCRSFSGDLGALGQRNVGFAANLEIIDISGCVYITGNIEDAFKSCRNLREVDLSESLVAGNIAVFSGPPAPQTRDPVTRKVMLLPKPTPPLHSLILSGCRNLCGNMEDIKICTNLIIADFNSCRHIEGDIAESVTFWRDVEVIDLQRTKAHGDVACAFGDVVPKHLKRAGLQSGEIIENNTSKSIRKLRKLYLFNMKINGESSFAFNPKTTPFLEVLVAKRTGIFVHDADALRRSLPQCDMVI